MKQNKHNHKPESLAVQFSKACSYLLRHGALDQGLAMRPDGFVLVEDLLEVQTLKRFKANVNQIHIMVNNNEKKRFELKEIEVDGHQKLHIRAVQGHTLLVDDELLLEKIIEPLPCIIHGTYLAAWELIKQTGLNTMARNHIHFAIGMKGDEKVISGMRGNCQVFIEVDMGKAMNDGMIFYISKNKVVLTAGFDKIVAPKYFKRVTDVNGNDLH